MTKVTPIKKEEDDIDLSREGLPPELIAELSKGRSTSPVVFTQLAAIVGQLGDNANVDNISIAYYRKHNEIIKRAGLVTRLNTMADRELIDRTEVRGYWVAKKTDDNKKED